MDETTYSHAEEVNLSMLNRETPRGNEKYVTPIRKLGPALGTLGQLPARGRNRSPNVSPISYHSTPAASPNVSPISHHSTPAASPNVSSAENYSNNNLPPPPKIKRQKTKRSRKYRKASRKNRRN
jgi:hypothetical protein